MDHSHVGQQNSKSPPGGVNSNSNPYTVIYFLFVNNHVLVSTNTIN